MSHVWKRGDIIAWRAVFRNRVWSALSVIVVKDAPEEMVLTLPPGAECMAEKDYAKGKKNGHRRWDFKDKAWELETYFWRANRLLLLLAPQRYYSTIYFWNGSSNEFLCYYINFQLPFQRTHCGINTLDLELDLIINPDLSYEWKDVDDFQKATEHGIISPEWIQGIENAKPEIFDQLEKRQYPFDGSWLDWRPDPSWSRPTLPENWDKI
jgi:hypothetical protein